MEETIYYLRKATLEDLDVIRKLNNDLFKLEKENFDPTLVENWPLTDSGKEYFEDLIKNHYVVVAKVNQEVVGYLAGSINEKGSYEEVQYGELNNMFVKERYRSYGIGRKLVDDFKNYCKAQGINNIKVVASFKNKKAIDFYHKNGFDDFNLTLTMTF